MAPVTVHIAAWFAGACSLVNAGQFLAQQRWGARDVSAQLVQDMFAARMSDKKSHDKFKVDLQTMYNALPKNEHGLLDAPTARYALHRHFVHKFGWYVRGLDPKGQSWNSTSTDTISKNHLAQHVQSLFARDVGMDLSGLAAFASVLSGLMEEEVDAGLEEIFLALKLPTFNVSQTEFDQSVEGYLARFILGLDEPITNEVELMAVIFEVKSIYNQWPEAAMWSRDVVRTHDWLGRDQLNPFVEPVRTLDTAISNVRGIMHRFNHLANPECFAVKRELVEQEVAGTGRVSLAEFYSNPVRKRESIDYLRNLGVLDESIPNRPMLLITNFIISSANCLVDSSYYSLCCPSQCESLMNGLESVVQSPVAMPERIADIVSQMPTDTVDAPRNISSTMMNRLQGIADQHGGMVPLNGRLFAQWMHHAYPRECPYPQQTGVFKPLSQDDFIEKYGVYDVFVSKEEMLSQIEKWQTATPDAPASEDLPWDSTEELVALHSTETLREWKFGILRPFMVLAAFASMALPLLRSSSKLLCGSVIDDKKTLMV